MKTTALESLYDEVARRQACNSIKNKLQHRCFHVNIAIFKVKNTSGGCF